MVDRMTGKFKSKFKTYAICGAICRVELAAAETLREDGRMKIQMHGKCQESEDVQCCGS